MTGYDQPRHTLSALGNTDVDFDTLYGVLADSNRRFIVSCLDDHPGSLTLRDLTIRLVAREHDVPITAIPEDAFEPTYVHLYHSHIPKLAAGNIVEYDPDRNTVALSNQGEESRVAVLLAKLDQ